MSIGVTELLAIGVILAFAMSCLSFAQRMIDSSNQEAIMSRLDTLGTLYRSLDDTLNPVDNSMVDYESSEEKDVADVELAMEHEIEENIRLNERVARLKEDIADRHVNTYTPQPPIPLHPDVYNIPDAKLPDTDHMVEYAE